MADLSVGDRVKYVATDSYWTGRTGVVREIGKGASPMLVVLCDVTGERKTWPAGACMAMHRVSGDTPR